MSKDDEDSGLPFVLHGVTQIEDTEGVELAEPLVAPWRWTQPLVCFPLRADWERVRICERHPDGVPYGYRSSKAEYAKQYQELLNGREPYPAPEWSSHDDPNYAVQVPAPVLKLAEFAREASWEVVTQYSRGREPHGSTGKPGALKDYIGLRFGGHPMTRRQAYAITSRTVGRGTWTWDSVQIWGPDLPAFAGCGVTELKTFLESTAMLPAPDVEEWVRGIAGRRAEQARAAKERAASRPKPSSKRETS